MMLKRFRHALILTLLQTAAIAGMPLHIPARAEPESNAAARNTAAQLLEKRGDARSLATAAALLYAGPGSRSRADAVKAAAAGLDDAVKATQLSPNDPAIGWLRLHLCEDDPACDIRDAATTQRWVDADNAAAWLPTLAGAQRDKDAVQIDRVLADMAEGSHFDLYLNRSTVMMFDALRRVRAELPARYAYSDLTRLTEAMELADGALLPSFSPLINACREAGSAERREACLALSKTMQKGDTVLTQLVGFAVEKRLTPADSKEMRMIMERRRLLEWRAASANISDTPLLPWLRNARARSRLGKMRTLHREEDVYVALLKEHGMPLEPREDHR